MLRKLYDRQFPRTMARAFGFGPFNYKKRDYKVYFQYKIGPYEKGHQLCFLKKPLWGMYKGEIFDKMGDYYGYDVSEYLDFHFEAYGDKADFLRFLRYELGERIPRAGKPMDKYRLVLETAQKWVTEKEVMMASPAPDTNQIDISELMRSHAGNIVIDGRNHVERFIQLLILVKEISVPGKPEELLFSHFSTTDLAAVLAQVKEFRDMKVNTLQKKISDGLKQLRRDDPRNQQLIQALSIFFYGQTDR